MVSAKSDKKALFVQIIYYVFLLIYCWYLLEALIGYETMIVCVATSIIILLAIVLWLYFSSKSITLYGTKLASTEYLIIIVMFLMILVIYPLSTWIYNNNYLYYEIKRRMDRTRFIPISKSQGEINSQSIRRKLAINGENNIIPSFSNFKFHEIMASLMMTYDSKHENVNGLITGILGSKINEPDVAYNLIWYLMVSSNPLGLGLSKPQIKYLLKLSVNDLQNLLGKKYEGLTDRASMLFALISGHYVPKMPNISDEVMKRNEETVRNFPPNVVFAEYLKENILNDDSLYYIYPPYIKALTSKDDQVMKIMDNNLDELIDRFELGDQYKEYKRDKKAHAIIGDLSLYDMVFNRPKGLQRPCELEKLDRGNIRKNLYLYTNKELIENYEPRADFSNRYELIKNIHMDLIGPKKWAFTHSYCSNDDSMNIITGESHGEIDKYDKADPTLSFGNHKNYKCYQMSELESCFRIYDGIFEFRIPDWLPGQEIKEYELGAIIDLKELLIINRKKYNVEALLSKINLGIELLKSAKMQTLKIKTQYENFTKDEQESARLYIGWMFTYSMWMRFWKGPGYDWPMEKVDIKRKALRDIYDRASIEERDEHVSIQQLVQSAIIDDFEKNTKLYQWIMDLPAIYYEFDTGESKCANYPISKTLEETALGKLCMGFSSDTILKTSVFYITDMLGIPFGRSFDDFVYDIIQTLCKIELPIIQSKIYDTHIMTPKLSVYNKRYKELNKESYAQHPFNKNLYQNNIHVEN